VKTGPFLFDLLKAGRSILYYLYTTFADYTEWRVMIKNGGWKVSLGLLRPLAGPDQRGQNYTHLAPETQRAAAMELESIMEKY
jgi:hypothetical protein